jgi:hypothetical protein
MSNRVLKRPMFRRGGMANQGIMTGLEDRSGYENGGDVVEDSRTFFEKMVGVPKNFDNMTREEADKFLFGGGLKGDTQRLMTTANDLIYNYGMRPIMNLGAYITGIGGEGLNTFGKIDTDQAMIDSYSGTVRDDEGNIISTNTKEDPDADPDADSDDDDTEGKEGKGGTGGKGDLSESDLKTVYADLLPMFKETLGVDDEDFKKDAYLQLARFGTNLMAQPGGSLTAAIGRAAQEPLEGVGEIIGAKRAAERRPKELALQAALRETEPGNISKAYRDLKKLGYSDAEIKKYLTDKGGDTGLAQVKARIIKEDEDAILAGNLVPDQLKARQLAKKLDSLDIGIEEIAKMPDDKDGLIENQIYVSINEKSGAIEIRKHKKGKLYKPGEKGFN